MRCRLPARVVQVCTLLSVKTGGCPEDCAYCPQAARYQTEVQVHKLLEYDEVITKALIGRKRTAAHDFAWALRGEISETTVILIMCLKW